MDNPTTLSILLPKAILIILHQTKPDRFPNADFLLYFRAGIYGVDEFPKPYLYGGASRFLRAKVIETSERRGSIQNIGEVRF
jgi:hypothetical protein